jgi:hypothetical protein
MAKTKAALPVCKAFWSLLWRSVVLAPFLSLLFAIWFLMWAGGVTLPVVIGYLLIQADWQDAAKIFATWLGLLWLTRWKLWKLFQVGPKDTLNSQENV